MSATRPMVTRKAQGFTLVEILIVVVILGILAAIVIPQFTRASESAQAASVASQLQTIRSQIELYQVQHGGQYPELAGSTNSGWGNMLSEVDGYGPYFQQAPRNPLSPHGSDDRATIVDASSGVGGWVWDSTNRQIMAIVRDDANTVQALENSGLVASEDFVAVTVTP